jgi:hypothetical protein
MYVIYNPKLETKYLFQKILGLRELSHLYLICIAGQTKER